MEGIEDTTSEIEIDLSRPHFFVPTGMVPLVALVNDLCEQGRAIDVVPPEDDQLSEYWVKAGWVAGLRDEDSPELAARTTFTPLKAYSDHSQLNEQLNIVLDVWPR